MLDALIEADATLRELAEAADVDGLLAALKERRDQVLQCLVGECKKEAARELVARFNAAVGAIHAGEIATLDEALTRMAKG